MPITRLGFLQADAIDAMDKDEVLVAKIQSSETRLSNFWNNSFLISKSSTIASMINSESFNSNNLSLNLILSK